jgi:hypothetical protein
MAKKADQEPFPARAHALQKTLSDPHGRQQP